MLVGGFKFNDGFSNDPRIPGEVSFGKRLRSWDDGNWHYEYWEYGGHVIGLQWNGRSYAGAWVLDGYDKNLLLRDKRKHAKKRTERTNDFGMEWNLK